MIPHKIYGAFGMKYLYYWYFELLYVIARLMGFQCLYTEITDVYDVYVSEDEAKRYRLASFIYGEYVRRGFTELIIKK